MEQSQTEYSRSLTEDQDYILECFKRGENIFMTGPGGSGKSFTIYTLYQDAIERKKKIQLCATTGKASVLLRHGATTINAWAGIGTGKGDQDKMITSIMLNRFKRKSWMDTDILICDEVSMMSKSMFELLDRLGKRIRKSDKPFGGIQLVFSGDFYQLPPVGDKNDPESSMFCFESPLWGATFDVQIPLDKVFRQQDESYVELLNQIREGHINPSGIKLLKTRVGVKPPEGKQPIQIYSRKQKVNAVNDEYYSILSDTKEYTYVSQFVKSSNDSNSMKNQMTSVEALHAARLNIAASDKKFTAKDIEKEKLRLQQNVPMDEKLKLKLGCRVMCVVNLDTENGLCNGSVGTVIGFSHDQFPIVQFDEIAEKRVIREYEWKSDIIPDITLKQIPLVLAWAMTIHKAQGATLDSARMSIGSDIFEYGQCYVALSRVKSLEGLYLDSFDYRRIKARDNVASFYAQFYE